ncbi:MAG TPA: hypothetical protein VF708_07235 [Pyrinomonadaceae bacterium]|jgi:hypothetical protein
MKCARFLYSDLSSISFEWSAVDTPQRVRARVPASLEGAPVKSV